jgi:hypothetical protein
MDPQRMRHNSSRAIIPGKRSLLHAHLRKRKSQGVRMNINHLGEAVLGDGKARHGSYIARARVTMDGRIELLHYLQNQSICNMYHRCGNLGERAVI